MQQEPMTFDAIIDAIFGKLTIRYGSEWTRKWEGVDIAAVKADWKQELVGFSKNLEPLRHALKHLPVKCPNVEEFRNIANSCPPPEFKLLEAPRASAEYAKQVVAQVKQRVSLFPKLDPKDWARKLKARHEKGEKLGTHQINAYRQALGMKGLQGWEEENRSTKQ